MRINTGVLAALCCSIFLVACRFGVPASDPVAVTITSPANNTFVPMGRPIQVSVTATGSAGVSRVELSINGTLVAVSNNTQASSPYETAMFYTPLVEGPFNLIVRAYDKNNAASAPVGLTLQSIIDPQPSANPDNTAVVTQLPDAPTKAPATTPTIIPGVTGPGGCVLNAQFIADVTVADDTPIPLHGAFTKTWRVRNSGTCVWDSTYRLVFGSGDQLNAPGSVPLRNANPNDVIDVSVPMRAPDTGSGKVNAQWRFAAPNNAIFGNALTVVILLLQPTPTPTTPPTLPAPTGTATPTVEFSTDSTSVPVGGCTILRWNTNNVAAVYLNDTGVASPLTKQVCPTETTTYTLKVNFNDGTSTLRNLVITVTSGGVLYSFADTASSVRWYNDLTDTLTFGGPDTDSRGFAMNRDGRALEDGSLQLKVIETHPRWAIGGSIAADFDVPVTLQSGDRFRARIGFLNGASSGSVKLRVLFKGVLVEEISKAYDGTLMDWNINLSGYAGQTGKFTLQALGIPSATVAWICWINPRIER